MEYAISVLNKEIEDLKKAAAEPHIGIIEQSGISDAIGSCQVAVSDLTYLCEGEKPQQSESNCAIPVVVKSEITPDAKYLDNLGYEVQGLREAKTTQEKKEAWAAHLNQMIGAHQENEEYIEREMLKI